ncbi:hypothetical protein CIG75_02410 [Tumebacillus algifaecis]|uniref:Flagellar protein FliT n=1 Tax=Tumebacillus algifaecis TaxID=1214604 RepID=A0A223CXM9_9BACL|nr:hypothetical protein [Tumebacillus algifaecis]ASS73944.1 hypothetical protein CIG75_02410 [Tumebacillus algifaecis]
MTRLELARQILAGSKRIFDTLQSEPDEQLANLFDERQDRISDYLELELENAGQPQSAQEEQELQELMRESYQLNQQIEERLQKLRQNLYDELTQGDQMRDATTAYSSPYDNVTEPMFFDKKN